MSVLSTHVPWTVSTSHKVFNKSFYIMEGHYVSKNSYIISIFGWMGLLGDWKLVLFWYNFGFCIPSWCRSSQSVSNKSQSCFLLKIRSDPVCSRYCDHRSKALYMAKDDSKLLILFPPPPPSAEITSMTTTPILWCAWGWIQSFIYSRQASTNWATSPVHLVLFKNTKYLIGILR